MWIDWREDKQIILSKVISGKINFKNCCYNEHVAYFYLFFKFFSPFCNFENLIQFESVLFHLKHLMSGSLSESI